MKYVFVSWLFSLLLLGGCNNEYPKAENAFDAGREFIDATLKGEFDRAAFYMLHNEANDRKLEEMKATYRRKSNEEKMQYHDASINILEQTNLSDTAAIINYKNSFDNIARKVKVLHTDDGWLVDLVYTFDGNL